MEDILSRRYTTTKEMPIWKNTVDSNVRKKFVQLNREVSNGRATEKGASQVWLRQ